MPWRQEALQYMAYRSIGSEYFQATVSGKGACMYLSGATRAGDYSNVDFIWGSFTHEYGNHIQFTATNTLLGGTWVGFRFGCSDDIVSYITLPILQATNVFAFCAIGTLAKFAWSGTMGCGHVDVGEGIETDKGRSKRRDPLCAINETAFQWFGEGFFSATPDWGESTPWTPHYLGFLGVRLIDSADYSVYMDVYPVYQGIAAHGTVATFIFRGTNNLGKTINPAQIILYGTSKDIPGVFGPNGIHIGTLHKYFHDASWEGLAAGDVWEGTVFLDFTPVAGDTFTEIHVPFVLYDEDGNIVSIDGNPV